MNNKLIRIAQIILVIILIFSGYKIYDYYRDNKSYDKNVKELETYIQSQDIGETKTENKSSDSDQSNAKDKEDTISKEDQIAMEKIQALQAEYPEIIGWITVPGTNIDHPFVQGEDNYFYLNHDFKGAYHAFGTVFMEKDNKPDFSDQNTILYGHNIRSGKFFHELTNYREPGFVEEHPYIEIQTIDGLSVYEIFAVYDADPYDNFRSPSYEGEAYDEFVNRIIETNEIDHPLPKTFDEILTLQTCLDNDRRLVIHGKKIK